MGSYRYQDRWKCFLPASRISLNAPGPPGKAKLLCHRTRFFPSKNKHKMFSVLIYSFWGALLGGIFFYRLRYLHTWKSSSGQQQVPMGAVACLEVSHNWRDSAAAFKSSFDIGEKLGQGAQTLTALKFK